MFYKKIFLILSLFSFNKILTINMETDLYEKKVNTEKQELNKKLLLAASNGTINDMINVIKQGADIHYVNSDNQTALFFVIAQRYHVQDDLEKTKLLIWSGLNPDTKDKHGNSAINVAWSIHTHCYGQAIADKRHIINFITKYALKINKINQIFETEKQKSLKLILENVTHIKDLANIILAYSIYDAFELYKANDDQLKTMVSLLKV